MKIAVLSDFHFGFGSDEIEEDCFDNADEAMEKALNSDLILLAGDLFDSRVPKTTTWAKAIKILVKPLLCESSVKLVSCSKELKKISQRTLQHLPVLAIHGTHERRGGNEINSIEALENAGILVHLHCHTIVFEKDGIKVAIHGMSGVPERFAKQLLDKWGPKPIEGCKNILMIHQSIDPYIYSPIDPPSLSTSNLPKGFDFIICGHMHISGQERIDGTTLLVPGSTIVTQQEENEASAQKGFYEIEIGDGINTTFIPLQNNRKFFYESIEVSGSPKEQVEKELAGILNQSFVKQPLVKIKVIGKETDVVEQELKDIANRYSGRAIINFVKELESPEMMQKIEFLRNLREQSLSVEEIGLNLLMNSLTDLGFESSFDVETLFNLLSEGNADNAFNILVGKQKTLERFK